MFCVVMNMNTNTITMKMMMKDMEIITNMEIIKEEISMDMEIIRIINMEMETGIILGSITTPIPIIM